jgi:hypothetical protein
VVFIILLQLSLQPKRQGQQVVRKVVICVCHNPEDYNLNNRQVKTQKLRCNNSNNKPNNKPSEQISKQKEERQ